jgi:threonine aldolase
LGEKFVPEFWGKYDAERDIVRFCTSWATKAENVDALCEYIERML